MIGKNSLANFSFARYDRAVCKLYTDISDYQATHGQFDYIVGIARGGSILATHLSYLLGVPVVIIDWSTRDEIVGKEEDGWLASELYESDKKILLVDDIVDSGKTVIEVIEHWAKQLDLPASLPNEYTWENIKVAALVYNTKQPVEVDFYYRAIDRDLNKEWFYFWWEKEYAVLFN